MNAVRCAAALVLVLACAPKPSAAEPVAPTTTTNAAPVEPAAAEPAEAPQTAEPVMVGKSPPTGCTTQECHEVDEAIGKMKMFAEQMCACRGRGSQAQPCIESVTGSMVQYGEAMARKYEGRPEPAVSDMQKQEMEAAMEKLTSCTTEALTGSPPQP